MKSTWRCWIDDPSAAWSVELLNGSPFTAAQRYAAHLDNGRLADEFDVWIAEDGADEQMLVHVSREVRVSYRVRCRRSIPREAT